MPRALRVVPLAGLMLLLGCGGGLRPNVCRSLFEANTTNCTPGGLPITISLLPSTTVVSFGQTVTVDASVYDQSNKGATWTVLPVGFGTLSDATPTSVTYTAPATFAKPTTVTITATSITNPFVTSSVQISASPVIVSLNPVAPRAVNQNEQVFITPTLTNDTFGEGVTWSLSPASGAGTLDNPQPFLGVYVAPPTVTVPTTVTVTATAIASPSATASLEITVFPSDVGPNTVALRVDGGPVPGQPHTNGAFTSVVVCKPGSAITCQKIDGVLVDTGSYGLRILQTQLPLFSLSKLTDRNGNILENCASQVDGSYIWGQVSPADIYIGSEIASSALIQVISSSNGAVPDGCSNGGTINLNTPQLLGANGILGIGPEPTDCVVAGVNHCDGSVQPVPPNLYYACPSKGCLKTDPPIVVPSIQQVTNPVTLFGIDHNGVILDLPAVSGSTDAVIGKLIIGIGTTTNNDLGSATVFTTDSNGNLITIFNGQNLTSSFIDSGSSALLFPYSLPICTASPQFFCPPSSLNLSAIIQGATQGQSTVNFAVDNADNLFSSHVGDAVFGTLAGPPKTSAPCPSRDGLCSFQWGLPFFYGRRVYTAIDGQTPPAGAPPGPWWAY